MLCYVELIQMQYPLIITGCIALLKRLYLNMAIYGLSRGQWDVIATIVWISVLCSHFLIVLNH
jgi:hypothetical protein